MLKSTMSFTCYLQMVGYIIKHVYPDGRLVYHVINMISSDGGLHQKPIAPRHQMVAWPTI